MSPPTGQSNFSLVIPVFNEEAGFEATFRKLVAALANAGAYEIIVVDDGSTDGTPALVAKLAAGQTNVTVLTHDRNRGYGAALKTGIRATHAEMVAITDGDDSYPAEAIPKLVALCADRDMVVGARIGKDVTYSKIRAIPKWVLTRWVSWIARQKVPDINSGQRVFRKSVAEKYLAIFPDTFSFTISITLAMLTSFRRVHFEPIDYRPRKGSSKIKPIRDTLRFMMIILRTGVYFAPMRIFMPACLLFGVMFLAALLYDVFIQGNLSDKTTLLAVLTLNTGMFGLLADMIARRGQL